MPDITNYDGRLEMMAYYCEQMLDNIAKVNNAYHDSVENKYIATMPDNLIKWKRINLIGGKTVVWNQLVDTGATEVATISGHIYYTLIDGTASIVTSDGTAISVVDDSADMVCDLTLMLGSGNEFATTDAFTEVFPATHYEYNPGELLSAGVTDVVSKDSSSNTLQTFAVPAEVQALEGYGWSAGTAYNYIDWERKKFVQCVDRVDLGSLSYTRSSDIVGQRYYYSNGIASAIKMVESNDVVGNIISAFGETRSRSVVNIGSSVKTIATSTNGNIQCFNKEVQEVSAATFKESVKDTYFYYELATPVETDISAYLTDENITVAESGGTITFENQHADDYKIPVPVQLEYIGV